LRTDTAKTEVFVYPDPPLGTEELRLLLEFDPELRLTTLILAPGQYGGR
jgi:hypothetical protein